MRLQLELLKTEMALAERGIVSTVVMFGSARIPDPATADPALPASRLAPYYDEARAFARLAAERALATGNREFVVCTGGGPGIMEAGSRGAHEAGGISVSLNIVLPHEQVPNRYGTPELSFNFHYFAIRKMHFLMRARALAVFPGGFGTLDELFEVLTLVQTGRMSRLPILLFGGEFWHRVIDWEALVEAGTVAAARPRAHHPRRQRRRGLGTHRWLGAGLARRARVPCPRPRWARELRFLPAFLHPRRDRRHRLLRDQAEPRGVLGDRHAVGREHQVPAGGGEGPRRSPRPRRRAPARGRRRRGCRPRAPGRHGARRCGDRLPGRAGRCRRSARTACRRRGRASPRSAAACGPPPAAAAASAS